MIILTYDDFTEGENGNLEALPLTHEIYICPSDDGPYVAIRLNVYSAIINRFGSCMLPWCNHYYGDWQFFGEYQDVDEAISALPKLLKHVKPKPFWKALFSFINARLKS